MNALLMQAAREIARRGGRALLVGGCVRDAMLGVDSQDIDCEVHGLSQEELLGALSPLGEIDKSGEAFGVYTLPEAHIDFALPRRETRTGARHADFTVTLLPELSPAQAAARRDFTVNAIMRDALTGELIDPYGGSEDLRRGVLRAVPGGQFEEDPLRVLRGAQFSARFHLTPDGDTLAAMRRMPLDALSPARVMDELKKALLGAAQPDVFFRVLEAAGALSPWFVELAPLRNAPQSPKHHPEGDAFEHTMLTLRAAAAMRDGTDDPLAFMLAALTHDLGKPATVRKNERGEWQAAGHELAGIEPLTAMLTRLDAGKQTIAYCRELCRLHMRVHTCYYRQEDEAQTNAVFDECPWPRALAQLVVCDVYGTGAGIEKKQAEEAFVMARLQRYEEAAAREMPTGDMLMEAGAAPGPGMKAMLARARAHALSGMDAREAARLALREERGNG